MLKTGCRHLHFHTHTTRIYSQVLIEVRKTNQTQKLLLEQDSNKVIIFDNETRASIAFSDTASQHLNLSTYVFVAAIACPCISPVKTLDYQLYNKHEPAHHSTCICKFDKYEYSLLVCTLERLRSGQSMRTSQLWSTSEARK